MPTKHFREEMGNECLEMTDVMLVLTTGRIYDPPEQDIQTRKWKYRIEGHETSGNGYASFSNLKGRTRQF